MNYLSFLYSTLVTILRVKYCTLCIVRPYTLYSTLVSILRVKYCTLCILRNYSLSSGGSYV